ncbi:MAG: hypothetical protein ABI480_17460 [Chitinophagaceae bacterium]
MRAIISSLILLGILVSCTSGDAWNKKNLSRKLDKIFPAASTIHMYDATESKINVTDSFGLPAPYVKAVITEKNAPSSIIYFYNYSIEDTTIFAKIFKAVMMNDLRVGLSDNKPPYVLEMPKFDKTGSRTLVWAISITGMDSAYLVEKEKVMDDVLDLQHIKMKAPPPVAHDSL